MNDSDPQVIDLTAKPTAAEAATEADSIATALGIARLAHDMGRTDAPILVADAQKRLRALARTIAGGLAAFTLAVGLAVSPAGTGRAEAAVITVKPGITVTASGPTVRLDTDVVSTAAMTRDGGHGVWLTLPSGYRVTGTAASGLGASAALVHVGGSVPARALTAGTTTATLQDIGDGGRTPIRVTVLRQSRITLGPVMGLTGAMLVTGQAAHYDLPTGLYAGDQQSTVDVQVFTGGRWVKVASLSTARDGSVAGVVPMVAGRWQVRVVRQAGATVTGGVSVVRSVTVASQNPEGWDY